MPGPGQHVGLRARDTVVVLIACAANVCRSPHLAALLERELTRSGTTARVVVITGGVDAATGAPACARLTALLPTTTSVVAGHRAAPVTAELLQRADLVIATSRAERTRLALIEPAARERMFTAHEFVRLAAGLPPLEVALVPGESVRDRVGRLTMSMHRRRAAPPAVLHPVNRRTPPDLWDIPDAHTSRVRHSTVARQLGIVGGRLAESVEVLTGGRPE